MATSGDLKNSRSQKFVKIQKLPGSESLFHKVAGLEAAALLTLLRMGLFEVAHGWGEIKKAPLPKICPSYSTMIKLGTVIPYLKKIQKIYKSLEKPLEFCLHQHFFTGNRLLLLCQKIQK